MIARLLVVAFLALTSAPAFAQFTDQRVWGGTSGGSANAQTLTIPNYRSLQTGVVIRFIAGFTNTSTTSLNVSSSGATTIQKSVATGLTNLTGGEITANNVVAVVYDGTRFVLLSDNNTRGPQASIASSGTTDLGTITSHNALITGTTTITALGSSANANDPIYYVTFQGALTLTHNASSLIVPGGQNYTTAAGDTAIVEYLGSGNWRVRQLTRAAQSVPVVPMCGASGLTIFNNSGTPNTQIDVAASIAVLTDSSGNSKTRSSVSATINTANTNVINGIDGARSTDTWYNIYIGDNGTTTGAYASTATVPGSFSNTPSGYTFWCRLGAMKTDGSGNFYRTRQTGRETAYTVVAATNTAALPAVVTGTVGSSCTTTTPTWSAVTIRGATGAAPIYVPSTATDVQVSAFASSLNDVVLVAPNNAYAGIPPASDNRPPLGFANSADVGQSATAWLKLEANTIQACASEASRIGVLIMGWRDAVNAN